ncbi:MAG: hypothetical protein LCH53_03520 [Bacteroidetes bacterium]|nr:hypothetical protein [Bacteroidota bacterium]
MHRPRFAAAIFATTAALAWAGCDLAEIADKLSKISIPLGSLAQNVPVASGVTVAGETTFDRPGGNLPDVFDVTTMTIDPADLTFQAGSSSIPQNGTIEAAFIVGGYVAGMTTATVQGGQITAISPTTMSVGTFDATKFQAMYAEAQPSQPSLASDWNTIAPAQAQKKIGTAMRSSTFAFAMIARTTGQMQGSMSLSKVTVGLSF